MVCLFGGYWAMGGHLGVLMQPWELVIIGGSALGAFIVANPMVTIKDSGKATAEALRNMVPKQADYLDMLSLLHTLMREVRSKSSAEVEGHLDSPQESAVFQAYPKILKNKDLVNFITDYFRLIIIGNARPHEIEALMDEEIHTITRDRLKPYHSMQALADGLPALGIVAAVLGVIKAMSALDKPPEVLGHLIGAALVGTFLGIFLSYALVGPLASNIKVTREKQTRLYAIVKQSLLAFMNGANPQIAVEHGRKTISSKDRPTIDQVEEQTSTPGPQMAEAA